MPKYNILIWAGLQIHADVSSNTNFYTEIFVYHP